MFYLVLFFSILATIFTLSRETRQLLNDYTRESNIIDYIVIFIIYFIVFFILITINKFIGSILSFCFVVFFNFYLTNLSKRTQQENDRREQQAILNKKRIKKEKEKNKIQQEIEKKNKLEQERKEKEKNKIQQEIEKKNKLEQERLEQERLEENIYKQELNRYMNFISELKNTVNIFDTNIFMEKKYKVLFDLFIQNNIKILITEKQFQEIVNLKNSYDVDKNIKARHALNIIDLLSKEDIINIGFKSLSLDIDRKAYADPEIFEFCLKISEKTKVNFVTNDRILSIQTMQLAKKNNANNNLKVFNGDEFTILFKNNIPTRNILIFSDFFRNTY